MKKLLVLLGLLALPVFASAATGPDVLLTSGGNLFSIASETPVEGTSEATKHLVLTEQRGDQIVREVIPATNERGQHVNPLLGYDNETGTLFVFWIKHLGAIYNQMFFVTRNRDGEWSEPTEFGNPYNYRENLRVAVTHKVQSENGGASTSGLSIHAAWWEFDTQTSTESAQYRMLTIEDGHVVDVAELDLSQFVDRDFAGTEVLDQTVLKFPLLVPSSSQDSVLLTFGSFETQGLAEIRVTPTIRGEGRLRVPIGKRDRVFNAPRLTVADGASLEGVFSEKATLALYTAADGTLRYSILKNGEWTETRTITLDDQITSAAAANALRRMVSEQ